MTTITWLQIFAAIFQLITSTSGACRDTNVGIRDELKVIPDIQMSNSSEKGPSFSAKFGRLHGTNAWCPDPNGISADGPYLQINLGQIYDICGVEAQGLSGTSVTTSFTLSYSVDGTFNDFNSNQLSFVYFRLKATWGCFLFFQRPVLLALLESRRDGGMQLGAEVTMICPSPARL